MMTHDPVAFVHRYEDDRDREMAGFIAAQFAYGKIGLFAAFLENLFARMDGSPCRFVGEGDFAHLKGLCYRFQKEGDILQLFAMLRRIIDRFGGIGAMLEAFYDGDTRRCLWRVREQLFGASRDLDFFFPRQSQANPQKRWNLYLRWMVRKDEIDVGLWHFIDKKDLVVPLDTHIFKIGRCLGWTTRQTPSWQAAREITEVLKEECPEDPLKYDFFLCHCVGIGAGCSGRRNADCEGRCPIYGEALGIPSRERRSL
jgi:uncharacterized protein (TIGR02757 family)